jgi:hypothetical protein
MRTAGRVMIAPMATSDDTASGGNDLRDSAGQRQPSGSPDEASAALRAAARSSVRIWSIGVALVLVLVIWQFGPSAASGNLDIDGLFAACLLAFLVVAVQVILSRRRLGASTSLIPVLLERGDARNVSVSTSGAEPLLCSGVHLDRLAVKGDRVWAWCTHAPRPGTRVALVTPGASGTDVWRVSWPLPMHAAGQRVAWWRQWS